MQPSASSSTRQRQTQYLLRPTILLEESQRRWLDKTGVTPEQWRFFKSFLEDALRQTESWLGLLEGTAIAYDWWLDVQADQRWAQAHPWRKWFTSSVCFSPAAFLLPFLYPAWLWDMDEVEHRLQVLQELHSELCRCVGLWHDGVYRLLQWRAEDPGGRAEGAVQQCKAQIWLRSMLLEQLTQRVRGMAVGPASASGTPTAAAASQQEEQENSGLQGRDSSTGSLSTTLRRPAALNRKAAVRAAAELENATHAALTGLQKPGHVSRYRACYMALAVGVGGGLLLLRGQSLTGLVSGCVRQARSILSQFLQDWVLEPANQLSEELLPTVRKQLMSEETLQKERTTLTNMTKDFYKLINVPVTPEVEAHIAQGEIGEVVSYFEGSCKEPIKNSVRGHLAASSMVQAQKMKVVMYDLCQNIDDMMRDVRLNVAVSSIFPLFTLLYSLSHSWQQYRSRTRGLWVSRCRQCLDEVDRLLGESEHLRQRMVNEEGQHSRLDGGGGAAAVCSPVGQQQQQQSPPTPTQQWQQDQLPDEITQPIRLEAVQNHIPSPPDFAGFQRQISGSGESSTAEPPPPPPPEPFSRQISGSVPLEECEDLFDGENFRRTSEDYTAPVTSFRYQVSVADLDGVGQSEPELPRPSRMNHQHRLPSMTSSAASSVRMMMNRVGRDGGGGGSAAAALISLCREQSHWEISGLLISWLSMLWSTCSSGLSPRELRSFSHDLSILPAPDLAASQKLQVVARMRRAYSCFDRRL